MAAFKLKPHSGKSWDGKDEPQRWLTQGRVRMWLGAVRGSSAWQKPRRAAVPPPACEQEEGTRAQF